MCQQVTMLGRLRNVLEVRRCCRDDKVKDKGVKLLRDVPCPKSLQNYAGIAQRKSITLVLQTSQRGRMISKALEVRQCKDDKVQDTGVQTL